MFEFTLSKINMLIFVTAIAVIVIFFMNTLNDNLKNRQSYEIAFKIGKEIKSVIDSDSYCSIKFISIPKTIKISQGSSLSGITYKFGLETFTQFDNKSLVIYLTDHTEKKILGAYNIDYNGNFNFYSSAYNNNNNSYEYSQESSSKIIYQPRKVNSNETRFLIIKNIVSQEQTYRIIPCEKRLSIDSCKEYVCNEDNFNRTGANAEYKCLQDYCATTMQANN